MADRQEAEEEDLLMDLLRTCLLTNGSEPQEDAETPEETRGRASPGDTTAAASGSTEPSTAGEGSLDPDVVSGGETWEVNAGEELCYDARQLFLVLFGEDVKEDILLRWTNQGIRFSSDPDTCIGLVQHEGGPCGVLAAIQAFVLKYLLFFPKELDKIVPTILHGDFDERSVSQSLQFDEGDLSAFTEDRKTRALLLSMVEILFLCGSKKRAAIAMLNVPIYQSVDGYRDCQMISKASEGLSIESALDFQKYIRVSIYTSQISAFHRLKAELPVFGSRMGALLFLISALLSRGLESIQTDRDGDKLPLVPPPFGHASQEIVNLLLCGEAVSNVFDDQKEIVGGMVLKGIPGCVEVGFLTLLESLQYCIVGGFLKHPRWPIWVVGSESHYTVLFSSDTTVQDENELQKYESKIREAFNAQDQSGGGGFISIEGFRKVLKETHICMPSDIINNLCTTDYIVWSEFWTALVESDKQLQYLGDSRGVMAMNFNLYHFNGIAKSVWRGAQSAEDEAPVERPRLCKLQVSVPPMFDMISDYSITDGVWEKMVQLPLVDCIRTRWSRAICNWVGDAPSVN